MDEIEQTLEGMRPLGFTYGLEENEERHQREAIVSIEWCDRKLYRDDDELFTFQYAQEKSTEIAENMVRLVSEGYCRECARSELERLDFSRLAPDR